MHAPIPLQKLYIFNNQKTIQTRWNSTVATEQKVDSKAFAIPILTADYKGRCMQSE